MKDQLLFVYNANSDLFSALTDFAHKILSPATYDCHLCALTYGNFTIKQDWKSFIEKLPVETVFLHKDEFEKQYKFNPALPCAFLLKEGAASEIITRPEIQSCPSLEALKSLVTAKLKDHVQHHHSNIQ
jgi:hypothetical protein